MTLWAILGCLVVSALASAVAALVAYRRGYDRGKSSGFSMGRLMCDARKDSPGPFGHPDGYGFRMGQLSAYARSRQLARGQLTSAKGQAMHSAPKYLEHVIDGIDEAQSVVCTCDNIMCPGRH